MKVMKEKYEEAIKLIYDITKEHSEKEPIDGKGVYDILENVLEYIQDCVAKNIYEQYERNLFKIRA